MPKMKSHSGAKKRFRFTGTGKVRFKRAHMRHLLEHKSKTMKRKAKKTSTLSDADARTIHKLLPYG